MHWSEYESKVLDYFKAKFNMENIQKNIKLPGKLSGTLREIDVLVETQVADLHISIAIECKNWQTKLDVADIGSFIDKLNDIGISKGVMISKNGYTEAAYKRAYSENDIQLFVLDFENLNQFQGFWANPYDGDCGALISAPSGWVIDSNLLEIGLQFLGNCTMYPMNMSLPEALIKKEFAYFTIRNKPKDIKTVFDEQNNEVLRKDNDAKIKTWEEQLQIGKVLMREIYYSLYDYTEYTAGVDTERFHAYFIFNTKDIISKITLAKLKYVMNETHFIVLDGIDKNNPHKYWKNLSKILK